MKKQVIFVLAFIFSIVAALLFTAGSDTFAILPENIGNFSGMIAGGIAAVLWLIYSIMDEKRG